MSLKLDNFSSLEDAFLSKGRLVVLSPAVVLDHNLMECLADRFVIALNDSVPNWEVDVRITSIRGLDTFYPDALNPVDVINLLGRFEAEGKMDAASQQIAHFITDFFSRNRIELSSLGAALQLINLLTLVGNSRIHREIDLVGFGTPTNFAVSDAYLIGERSTSREYTGHIYNIHQGLINDISRLLRERCVFVTNVGPSADSDIPYEEYLNLNSSYYENLSDEFILEQRNGRRVQSGRVKVVGEITTNHYGDMRRLKALMVEAALSGCDGIKLQIRDINSIYSADQLASKYFSPYGRTFREYREAIELSDRDWTFVRNEARRCGLIWGVSVLDIKSYNYIKKFTPDFIKLPSTISEHKDLIAHVGRDWEGTLVFSTGYTDGGYDEYVVSMIKRSDDVYILQCTSTYPCKESDANVSVIGTYRDKYVRDSRIKPGFSSHDFGSLCSMLAIASGARMIEKHIRFGRVHWGHFDDVALDVTRGELRSYVADLVRSERILGDPVKRVLQSETHKYFRNN